MLLPAAKLGIGIGVFSALAAGAYGVVYLVDNSVRSLYDTGEYTDGNARFGDEFAYYFLSTKENVNANIWKARAKTLKNNKLEQDTNLESFFSDIKANATAESLKNICREKYNAQFPTSNKTKWKGIWVYCSIGGMRPKTIEEAKYGEEIKYRKDEETSTNNTFGKVLKEKLISVEDPANAWFWRIRQKEFKKGKLKVEKASAYFTSDTTYTLKDLCKRAYRIIVPEQETQSTLTPTKDEVEKYCGIRKVEQETK